MIFIVEGIMKVLNYKDISQIANSIIAKNEAIDPTIGSGSDRKVIIRQGLKIKHIPTGLVYTVTDVIFPDNGDPVIMCNRPGKDLAIQSKDFNEYTEKV